MLADLIAISIFVMTPQYLLRIYLFCNIFICADDVLDMMFGCLGDADMNLNIFPSSFYSVILSEKNHIVIYDSLGSVMNSFLDNLNIVFVYSIEFIFLVFSFFRK